MYTGLVKSKFLNGYLHASFDSHVGALSISRAWKAEESMLQDQKVYTSRDFETLDRL